MAWLADTELAQMVLDAESATSGLGSTMSVAITYTKQSARTYTPTSGAESETEVTGAVTAHRASIASIPGSKGEEAGDVCFAVGRAALEATNLGTSFIPARRDRITYESQQYEVLRWGLDAADLRYYIVCKLVAK